MNPSLSIVIPAFDEATRIGDTLRQILAYLSQRNLSAELIVVDDGSRDTTARVADEVFAEFPDLPAKVVRYEENRGKGFAVRTGLSEARADIALFSDADLSTPISELPKLIDPITRGEFDVTFGSRALDRSLIGTHQPWRREQGGKVFNLIVRYLTGLPFWDTQCGFKAFDMRIFRPMLPLMTVDRFGFDVEFLLAAFNNDLRLKEISVRWNDAEGSKLSFVNGLPAFAEVYKIHRNSKKGIYKLK